MSAATLVTLDINQIKEILPHRYPFLLVDRVTDLVPGQTARGYKNVTANEEFFNGHFPVKPIMPGVLIIEALGATGLPHHSLARRRQRWWLFLRASMVVNSGKWSYPATSWRWKSNS